MHRMLFAEMDVVLESMATRQLDQHRWGNVFNSGFKEYFRTIRHIKRYVNGLRLTLTPVAQEVNLVDFLAIELLRVFHPEVYLGVVRGKDMLAPQRPGGFKRVSPDLLKQWFEALCAKASPRFEDNVRELLQQLFPELARAYANITFGGSSSQWRRDCRVCAAEVFDKFFLLSIPTGEVSEIEIQAFVDGLADSAATKEYLRMLKEAGKGRRHMERLEDFTKDLPLENVPHLVKLMFDEGDGLRFESGGFLDITADMQVPRIVYQCLSRLPLETERHELLLDCVKNGTGLYTLVQEASLLEPNEKEPESLVLSSRALWEDLRDAAVARIQAAQTSGALWNVKHLPYVLIHWLEWTSAAEVQGAVNQFVAEDVYLLKFLTAFVTQSQSLTIGDKVSRKHMKLSKNNIAPFLGSDDVANRLRAIIEKSNKDADVARDLLVMLERKSESSWDD